MENLGRIMQNIWKTYDDITGILWKRKIRSKWCHSGNPLSEAVWAKNNWQPEWQFSKNAFEKWLTIFLRNFRKLCLADLQKTYENLTTNLGGKILRSYQNKAPVL